MSAATAEWFQVDRAGLAKLMERRGPEFVLYELVSNALDQTVTRIDVTLTPVEGKRLVSLVVEDDDPDGFQDLQHSFVLFAESAKKGSADKRGRFNLGEKLVLALCAEASISSTTGTVRFDAEGRHRGRTVRARGSRFEGLLRITRADMQTMIECAERILVPPGVTLVVNGREIAGRAPVAVFETTLDTELADDEGVLRRRARKTVVKVYEPLPGEEATLYEMGIPVVTSTFDRYHVSVEQKIPLTFERDNVTPAYLRALRTAVLNATHANLNPLSATAGWVRDALTSRDVTPEAVQSAVTARFGTKVVSYDPSDPEANSLAVVKGYTVVHSGHLSAGEWANVRDARAILPAGQVTPSPKPFHPDGSPLKTVAREDWTHSMEMIASYAERLAMRTIRANIHVTFTRDDGWKFAAAFGPRGGLTIHCRSFDEADAPPNEKAREASESLDALLIHEFAHFVAGNHLSEKFYDECCRIGAAAKAWAHEGASIGR